MTSATELPVTVDLTIYQGATFRKHFRYGLTDGITTTYQDFTNPDVWTAAMQVRHRHGSTVVLDLTTENGGVTLDDTGNILIFADADATSAVSKGKYKYDLELYQPAGDTVRLVMGAVTLSEEITVPVGP